MTTALAPAPPEQKNQVRPVALVDGQPILYDDLRPRLIEAAGSEVLEDITLDRLLAERTADAGVNVNQESIITELRLLGQTLARAAGLPDSEGPGLVDAVRRRRGLGPERFQALLVRNASLRALVRIDPANAAALNPTADDLATAYALKYGPRLRVRLILVRTQAQADQALSRLAHDPFDAVAASMSIDPSAEQGGLIQAFSPADANYPVAVRRAAEALQVGGVSAPIAVSWPEASATGEPAGTQQGFAILKLEARVPPPAGAPTPAQAAAALKQEIIVVRERAMMERLARDVLRNHPPTILDRALGDAWDQQHTAQSESKK